MSPAFTSFATLARAMATATHGPVNGDQLDPNNSSFQTAALVSLPEKIILSGPPSGFRTEIDGLQIESDSIRSGAFYGDGTDRMSTPSIGERLHLFFLSGIEEKKILQHRIRSARHPIRAVREISCNLRFGIQRGQGEMEMDLHDRLSASSLTSAIGVVSPLLYTTCP